MDSLPFSYTSRAGTLVPVRATSDGLVGLKSAEPEGLVRPGIEEQLSQATDFDTDIVVIGAGPAGYVGAIRAAQLGARTVCVEKGELGGVCLNIGCIPTKVLLACVAVLDQIKRAAGFGVKVGEPAIDIPTMMKRKQAAVKQLTSGVDYLFKKNKVRLIRGTACITDPHTVAIDTGGGRETVRANKILIATGSVPALLPIQGLETGPNVWTSTEALDFASVPKSMLIVGAGAIGLEAGYTFARLETEVLVVEIMSQILPAADAETATQLQKALEAAGMKFMLGSTVTRAEDVKGGKKVWIKHGEAEEPAAFEKVLVAVGRRAVLEGIGLDEVGIKHDKRRILVNERMQTSIPSIYAAGDCVGEPMLAHVGWTEGTVAVEHALGMDSRMSYKAFPACVYTSPECASVGLTEEQARERYRDIRTGRFSFKHNGKAIGMGETEGFVKFITEPRFGEVLGVHIVGPHATDLISEAMLAVKNELTINEVIATIHPHPTLSEVVQEAALDTEGRSIHK